MKQNICKHCSKSFPDSIYINGKRHRLNNRFYCLDCNPFNSCKKPRLGLVGRTERKCPMCKLMIPINQYHKKSANCKKCESIRGRRSRNKVKQLAVDYKGGKCQICGYNKSLSALDFHHISNKTYNICKILNRKFSDKLKLELDHTILLCINCHREEEARAKGASYAFNWQTLVPLEKPVD